MAVVLACDLGSTSLRAALIDERGGVVGEARRPGPLVTGLAGAAEVDPDAWWEAFTQVCGSLASDNPHAYASIQGIAICGVTRTQVFVGVDGVPLRPAITWRDVRSEELASRLRQRQADRHPEAANINAFHPLARLSWLKEAEPVAAASLACLLDPKDYINARLTGVRASDPVSMARLLAAAEPGRDASGAPTADLLSVAGFPRSVVPALREPWEVVGPIRLDIRAPFDGLPGIPVFCGSNDTWAAVLGLGAMRDGIAYNISGTTEVLGIVARKPLQGEGLLSVDWRGLHQLGGPSQNGADTVAWFMSILGEVSRAGEGASPLGEGLDILLSGPRQLERVLFLPYLQGERVPYWDPSLRGAFVGLGRRHTATDLAWAVLEGIAFQNRVVLERAEEAVGIPVSEIRFGGGAAANARWRQIKADVCGRTVLVGEAAEPGLLGAAALAWTGLGRFSSLAAAQEALVQVAAIHRPDPARSKIYDAQYSLFRRTETALAPISRDMVALAQRLPA